MEIEQGLEKDRTKRSSAASPEFLRKILKIAFEYSSGYSKDKGEYFLGQDRVDFYTKTKRVERL